MTRIVCLSDTHGRRPEVPDGDVLLHCGDLTTYGSERQLIEGRAWLASLPHADKVFVAGNHDRSIENWGVQRTREFFAEYNILYLEGNTTHVVGGFKVWGGPWILPIWGAFEVEEEDMPAKWALIPDDTDIVMTHTPARNRLDLVVMGGWHVGCEDLRLRLEQVRPRLHVHGHIHEAAGRAETEWGTVINAAVCNFPNHDDLHPVQYIDL